MIYYLYFSSWNPKSPFPSALLDVQKALDDGKMVTVIFGLETKFQDKIDELILKSEIPIDWILIKENGGKQNLETVQDRLKRVPSDSKVVCLSWDEEWMGCACPKLNNRSTSK